MALGPLSFLGRAARQAFSLIRLGVGRLGATVAQIGRALENAGTAVEAGQLRRIADAERRLRRETRTVLGRPTSERLDPRNAPEAITRQRREFAWKVRTLFIDPRTGRPTDRFITVSTDRILSPDEAIEEATNLLNEDYDIRQSSFIEQEVVEVTRAAPGRRI